MKTFITKYLLLLIGVGSIVLSFISTKQHWGPLSIFVIACLGVLVMAKYMGQATESLAIISGPRIGGLLNATFGNAVELIISIFAIKAGLYGVVMASITGSVIGNLLLVGGLSFFVGGLKHKRQRINHYDASHNAGLMLFAIVISFVIPVVFGQKMIHEKQMVMSVGISILLIIMYLAMLFFKLVSHRGAYEIQTEEQHEEEHAEWGKGKSILVLALATLAVAYLSEKLVHTIEQVGHQLGWTEIFIGVIVVAIVGNAAEHASAVVMAYKNKADVSVEIAVGSTLQISMFVAPVLILISLLFGKGMPIEFSIPELIAMITSVALANKVMTDGDTNWLEGAMLLAAYVIMAIGFYLL